MNEVDYLQSRARAYLARAAAASDLKLREAYQAVALEFSVKSMTADSNRLVVLIDGLAEG